MSSGIEQGPFILDTERINDIRKVLRAADFSEKGILDHLNQEDSVRVDQKEIPRLIRLTAGGTPIDTLIRLFIMNVAVDRIRARLAVAPMTVESWIETGLLREAGDSVESAFRLIPSGPLCVAFDPSDKDPDQDIRPDHVHGPGPSSIRLLNATIRRKVGRVLDLGAGCGIQGLMCAAFGERVVSTDINPRALNIAAFNAALNGIENIEFRMGSLFEPVDQDRFDLILVNPPFAISPESRLIFRDGGMEADGFVERIVREAPRLLNDGGFCQLTAQWAHIREISWQERLQEWFRGNGCDVWVMKLATQSPASYAVNWISETEKSDRQAYARRWEDWMAYYESRDIEAVSTGLICMRKKNRSGRWYRFEEDIDGIDESAGSAIAFGFQLRDFSSAASNSALLETAFSVPESVRLQQRSRPSGDGWAVDKLVLAMTRGIHYSGNLDGRMIGLLGRCNRERPMGALIDALAEVLNVDSGQITESVLGIIRQLMERGFIVPSHLSGNIPTEE